MAREAYRLTKDIFVQRANDIHNFQYIYDNSDFVNTRTKLTITCPIHGDFVQTPKNHLNGQGCPLCGKIKAHPTKEEKINNFIKQSQKRFGEIYDFINIENEYEGSHSKITLRCKKCGKVFTKIANDHICSKNGGCDCERIKERIEKDSITYDELKKYITSDEVELVPFDECKSISNGYADMKCKIHGVYESKISSIVKGRFNCRKCVITKLGKSKSLSYDEFIEKLDKEILKDIEPIKETFDISCRDMSFKCKKCGRIFQRRPNAFLYNDFYISCPHCAKEEISKLKTKTTEQYIKEVIERYGEDEYDLSKVEYVSYYTPITIICKKCGREFTIMPSAFLRGYGCSYHHCNKSLMEEELANFLKEYDDSIITNTREILKERKEIDVYSSRHRIGFELDGLYWHNELNKDKNYHLLKTMNANEVGIRLVHIFEDEWVHKKDIWKSMILNMIRKTPNVIYARKCEIKEVDSNDAIKFLDENHLQGSCGSTIRLGLYNNNELVSIMTFGKSRHFIGSGKFEYELLRFCNLKYTNVVGGASKLFKHFIKTYNPKNIISYADIRWSQGNLYNVLGFNLARQSVPNYYYVIGNRRKNRINFMKSVLVEKYDCPQEISEHEFCLSMKWYRIYDCGCFCYEFINSNYHENN